MRDSKLPPAAIPSDLLYIRYTAAERHRRLADDARRVRLRRWSRK